PPVWKSGDAAQSSPAGRPNQPGLPFKLVPPPAPNGHESIVAVHSVNTSAAGGGVRWYEFRLDKNRNPKLYQQGTYAPDKFYRWMASPAMDRFGNIGIGYSFGGTPNFAGQRFTGRLSNDPPGQLTLREIVRGR